VNSKRMGLYVFCLGMSSKKKFH